MKTYIHTNNSLQKALENFNNSIPDKKGYILPFAHPIRKSMIQKALRRRGITLQIYRKSEPKNWFVEYKFEADLIKFILVWS